MGASFIQISENKSKLAISEIDLAGDTVLTIPQAPTTQSSSTQGSNTVQSVVQVSTNTPINTTNNGNSNTSPAIQANPQGITAKGGVFTPVKQDKLPIVYFNFKSNDLNTSDLLFRFKTSNLTNTEFGTSTNSWTSDSLIKDNLTLVTSGGNYLKVVKAYDKYFYELDATRKLTTVATLPVRTNPSYTILVFGLGRNSESSSFNVFQDTNYIHNFQENTNPTWYGSMPSQFINIGKINNSTFTASFIGNTLNSAKYASALRAYQDLYKNYVNISSSLFWLNFNGFMANTSVQKYLPFYTGNIKTLRSDINNPSTEQAFRVYTNSGSYVDMQFFSLFFVEMFCYFDSDSTNSSSNILNLETYINGQQTFTGKQYISKTITFDDFNSYNISLANQCLTGAGTSSNGTRLFLFDYMHGITNSETKMRQNSNKIIESLVYNYRNLFFKNTSDLQICNNSSSILFPPKVPHPFLNMFFQNS